MTEILLGGRYRLDEPIGRGGMAAVWRATDTVLTRPVAVKRLHAGLANDAELLERFRREALMVAKLSHPNLVHVLDRGEDDDGPYLVLELVEGEDLKSRIRREGPLPPAVAAQICGEVAQALAHAHGQGLIHRDIKAQNVLLSQEGGAKLADFGIARMIGAEAEGGLTRTDMLLGSADYLSPEQANGHALDARSDIYSLGIVLFECLTATLPFMGEGFVAVAMKHCSEPLPDPRTVVASIPPWLAEVVLCATEKDPDRRYPNAAALAAALSAEGAGGGTAIFSRPAGFAGAEGGLAPADAGSSSGGGTAATGRRRRRKKRPRRLLVGALLALLAVAATVAVLIGTGALPGTGGGDDPPPAAASTLTIVSVRDLDPPAGGGDGAENPDQRELATDGDEATAWFTEGYQDSANFGGLKDGVGLLLRLAAPARLTGITISSPTPGATFELQAAAPNGVRPVLVSGTFTDTPQTLAITTEQVAQSYVLWITGLADGGDGRYRAGVSEVTLQGIPVESDR